MKITLTTEINASIQQVFDGMVNPQLIMKWNTADPSWHCPKAEVDLKEGGHFRFRMEEKTTKQGFDFSGVYTQINKPTLLQYQLGDGRMIENRLTKLDEHKTQFTQLIECEEINSIQQQEQGWGLILKNFKAVIEELNN